jgi:hypothetical protein
MVVIFERMDNACGKVIKAHHRSHHIVYRFIFLTECANLLFHVGGKWDAANLTVGLAYKSYLMPALGAKAIDRAYFFTAYKTLRWKEGIQQFFLIELRMIMLHSDFVYLYYT